jgi:hypothetical protein
MEPGRMLLDVRLDREELLTDEVGSLLILV